MEVLSLKEIIIETILHYTVKGNPRSISTYNKGQSEQCVYNGPKGEQCAFARVCIEGTELEEVRAASWFDDQYSEIIKPEYQNHNATNSFWDFIQKIHDVYLEEWPELELEKDKEEFLVKLCLTLNDILKYKSFTETFEPLAYEDLDLIPA